MSFHRFLPSGAVWLTAALLLVSLAGSWVAAAPADRPAGAILAQSTPIKPPLPGGRPSPLRVMVPTDDTVRALQAAGITDITQISPNLDPIASFSPGPRMTVVPWPPGGRSGRWKRHAAHTRSAPWRSWCNSATSPRR
ncbi:MAG: hypothetical protein KatS3mg051_1278 [Anaerolineae bacterium]|nr:MAG: hypothetical protein KatS3mg051_1278 [Anaerolineae bacterium]